MPQFDTPRKSLHPKVLLWFDQHKRGQAEAARKIAAGEGSSRFFKIEPVIELTERDHYRFAVTSDLLYAFEAVGAKIESAEIEGKIRFSIKDWTSSITVAEKMHRGIGLYTASKQIWTAFPAHHHSGLVSTGFLRFTLDVFTLDYHKREWVEGKEKSPSLIISQIVAFLPDVIRSRIDEAEEMKLRDLERAELATEAEAIERQKSLIIERRDRYRQLASDWQEAQRLRAFLSELREISVTGEFSLDGVPLSEWIELAEMQINELDPVLRLTAMNLRSE